MTSFNKLKRKNETAIFLGCGPSINQLSEDDITKINKMDVWCNNNFIINNDIIPNFYHLEVKAHRNGALITDLVNKKQEAYKDVTWVLDGSRPYLLKFIKPSVFENIFCYMKSMGGNNGDYELKPNHVTVSCVASLTCVLDVMARMGYKKIYMAGVDLNSSEYFWTDNEKYADTNIPAIMNSCKPDERKADSIHPTSERNIQQFIKDFGIHKGIEIINLSKDSLLTKYLETETL